MQSTPVRPDPFAETPLQINPPTFRWPAATEAGVNYRVELARDSDFSDARVEIVSDLFFRPLEPLEPGTWHWRVRRDSPAAGPWIGTETFEITDGLPRWPLLPWSHWLE
ncbi:MAG: hypothetical protein ACREIA_18215 [Opitutaceae bacterium]